MSLPVIALDAIQAAVSEDQVLEAVHQALIAQAEGRVISPPPGQLMFDHPKGDCHIKYGYIDGTRHFAVKIASGFYDNPALGLPVTSGLILVFDAGTGQPVCLLDDRGWLTNMRTAAAGALAARAAAPADISALGIIGAGEQAELQARWISRLLDIDQAYIWSRRPEKAQALADRLTGEGVNCQAAASPAALLQNCNLVVTTTPATAPVLQADDVRPGTHIVAMGADSPGKVELDPLLFARASLILTDSHEQCLDHGDFGHAVRTGAVSATADRALGSELACPTFSRAKDDITITDLTGIAAEDIAVADLALRCLGT